MIKTDTLDRFHDDALIFDIHVHGRYLHPSPMRELHELLFRKTMPRFHPLSDLKKGDINGALVCIVGDRTSKSDPTLKGYFKNIKRQSTTLFKDIRQSGARVIKSSQDALNAKRDGVLACLPGVEGLSPMNGRIEILDGLYNFDFRTLTLVHFINNDIATVGVHFTQYWLNRSNNGLARGLTAFGEKVVRRMNQLGMLIDLAHANRKTFFDVLSLTRHPVIISHTGASTVGNFHRYNRDDELKAVAENGGVIGLWPMYYWGKGMADADDFKNHARHILGLTGEDHLAIGTDLQGVPGFMKGYKGVKDTIYLTQLLFELGLTEKQVRKILGLNFLRVLKEVTGQ